MYQKSANEQTGLDVFYKTNKENAVLLLLTNISLVCLPGGSYLHLE